MGEHEERFLRRETASPSIESEKNSLMGLIGWTELSRNGSRMVLQSAFNMTECVLCLLIAMVLSPTKARRNSCKLSSRWTVYNSADDLRYDTSNPALYLNCFKYFTFGSNNYVSQSDRQFSPPCHVIVRPAPAPNRRVDTKKVYIINTLTSISAIL